MKTAPHLAGNRGMGFGALFPSLCAALAPGLEVARNGRLRGITLLFTVVTLFTMTHLLYSHIQGILEPSWPLVSSPSFSGPHAQSGLLPPSAPAPDATLLLHLRLSQGRVPRRAPLFTSTPPSLRAYLRIQAAPPSHILKRVILCPLLFTPKF